jgi:DGQHR domain-containing protein
MQTLTLPAIELRQNGTRLLISKMRAADLIRFTKVDPYRANKDFSDPDQGYQRPAEDARVKKFANWLRRELDEHGKVRMPTAVLLSARNTDIVLSPNGTITLKESNKLPLVDGQHRTRGFEYAINTKGMTEVADYEVPVVILQDIDKVGEMIQFNVVNGTQKSVRTDLVNMILTQLSEKEGEEAVSKNEQWKVVVSHVVKRLNEDSGGPWYDQIVMPDQAAYSKEEQLADPDLRHLRVARATSFMTALKPIEQYLNIVKQEGRSVHERADDLFDVINAFWQAVRQLNPVCFLEADDYVLLKTPGIFALHRLCLKVMKDMNQGFRAWTEGEFEDVLSNSSELANPDYWAVGTDEGDRGEGAKYGSMKGFAELGDLLYAGLRD